MASRSRVVSLYRVSKSQREKMIYWKSQNFHDTVKDMMNVSLRDKNYALKRLGGIMSDWKSIDRKRNYPVLLQRQCAFYSLDKRNETENIFTIPNALCVARIGLSPYIAYLIVHHQYVPAIGLVTVAGITDLLDGWIARVVPGQASVCGSFLDPMADKILVASLFFSLTYMGLIPVPLTALVVGRDAILIAVGFYIRFRSLDPPRTLTRYFNITLPTAQLAPTFISKVNTGLQLSVVGATLMTTVVTSIDLHPYLQILWYCTAATTIASAVSYCFAKDTVKLLRQSSSSRIKIKESPRSSGSA